jgi:hypothetical protein
LTYISRRKVPPEGPPKEGDHERYIGSMERRAPAAF